MSASGRTASQKHAELKRLSSSAKQSVFAMLKLVDEILQEPEYVDQYGGESQLIDYFEANEFSHFGGRPSLPEMLRAYRHNPKKATWAEYNYNIQAMIELARPAKEVSGAERINWKKRAAELEEEVAALRAQRDELEETAGEFRRKYEQSLVDIGGLRERLSVVNGRGGLVHAVA